MEEAAIAKGVRRIVAVTRQAAIDAFGVAEALRDEFGTTRALPAGSLSSVLPALTEKLNAAVIPAAAKLELRTQVCCTRPLFVGGLVGWWGVERWCGSCRSAAFCSASTC